MYLERFAPSWREFHQRQMNQTRVLVVDDDAMVARSLGRTLERQGFTVESALSVAEAWFLIEEKEFDLILVDKTMPEESGLVLLKRLRESEYDVPSVLITGDASVDTIDEALSLGAEDYICKPFASTEHLVRRLRSVLDRRISSLLFDVMLSDLSKAVLSGTGKSDEFTRLSQSLLSLKVRLGKRPACAVVDDDEIRREERRQAIYDSGVIAIGVPPTEIDQNFDAETGPMVAAVSLETDNAIALIKDLRTSYPNLVVIAFAEAAALSTALEAIECGAADFTLLQEEGIGAATRRIERLVRQARRHHLYLEIVGLLYKAACEVRPDLAEDLIFAATESDREYILAR